MNIQDQSTADTEREQTKDQSSNQDSEVKMYVGPHELEPNFLKWLVNLYKNTALVRHLHQKCKHGVEPFPDIKGVDAQVKDLQQRLMAAENENRQLREKVESFNGLVNRFVTLAAQTPEELEEGEIDPNEPWTVDDSIQSQTEIRQIQLSNCDKKHETINQNDEEQVMPEEISRDKYFEKLELNEQQNMSKEEMLKIKKRELKAQRKKEQKKKRQNELYKIPNKDDKQALEKPCMGFQGLSVQKFNIDEKSITAEMIRYIKQTCVMDHKKKYQILSGVCARITNNKHISQAIRYDCKEKAKVAVSMIQQEGFKYLHVKDNKRDLIIYNQDTLGMFELDKFHRKQAKKYRKKYHVCSREQAEVVYGNVSADVTEIFKSQLNKMFQVVMAKDILKTTSDQQKWLRDQNRREPWYIQVMDSFTNCDHNKHYYSPFQEQFLQRKFFLCLKRQHCKEFATYFVFYTDCKRLDIKKQTNTQQEIISNHGQSQDESNNQHKRQRIEEQKDVEALEGGTIKRGRFELQANHRQGVEKEPESGLGDQLLGTQKSEKNQIAEASQTETEIDITVENHCDNKSL